MVCTISRRSVILSGVALSLAGCASQLTIEQITAQQLDQSVQVTGQVLTIAPLLNQVAYEVQEPSGASVWVLTRGSAPVANTTISVAGRVRFASSVIEGQEIGGFYLEQ